MVCLWMSALECPVNPIQQTAYPDIVFVCMKVMVCAMLVSVFFLKSILCRAQSSRFRGVFFLTQTFVPPKGLVYFVPGFVQRDSV